MDISLVFISLSISTLLVFISNKFFHKKNLLDRINERSSHKVVATRSGGIGVFISIFIISSFYYVTGNTIYDYSIIVPLALLVLIGLYDDLYNIDFKLKFIFQVIAAKIIIDTGLLIDNFHGVLGLYEINRVFAQLLTIFIILAIINALNFIDGIDGLAISIFSFFIIFFEFFSLEFNSLTNYSLLTLSSLVPMYYFNLRKNNKVFLGDSGSHLLGGIVSIYIVYILSQDYIIKPEYDIHKIIFVFSIFSYAIVDIVRVVFIRLLNKKSPFKADRRHLHHIILNFTKSHFKTVAVILLLQLLLLVGFQLLSN